MRTTGVVLAALVVLAASGCARPVDIEAEQTAIRNTGDVGQLNAAKAGDVERLLTFYEDGASMLPPGSPTATGKEAIREVWADITASASIDWQTTAVEVSSAGDLGYATGTYTLGVSDAEGNPAAERGKWVAIWKKQADGSWKQVLGIWNRDQEAPVSAAP